jgi:hypothetical protein
VDLEIVIPGRAPTYAELQDPELRARRVRQAAAMVADPSTAFELREQLRRDYLDYGGQVIEVMTPAP